MGLGGYLCWTAVAREIRKKSPELKIVPAELRNNQLFVIKSEIFDNNEDICTDIEKEKDRNILFPIILNDPRANYCKKDTPERAYHRQDRHIIEQYCEVYGIESPELRCYLKPDNQIEVDRLISSKIGDDQFITIEPSSNFEYTVNRAYPMSHWQEVVDELSKKIKVVQVGVKSSPKLKGAIDLTGSTTFKNTAAIIGKSRMFLSSEGGLVHAATSFETRSLVIITGYQSTKMVSYPQNININIGNHGPCGMKTPCSLCQKDADNHNPTDIIRIVEKELCL
jgi:ADP-heptose:LPS heptosyltransferase